MKIKTKFSPSLQLYSNNRKDVILILLRIGHTRMTHTHKHYLLNEEHPVCIACDCPLTVKHILIECGRYSLN